MSSWRIGRTLFTLAVSALLVSCGKGGDGASAAASAAALGSSMGAPVGGPFPSASVAAAVNPQHKAPYSGAKGTLRGTIRIDGDPPSETSLKFPDHCKQAAAAAYGKIFRVGLDKALADALVAVTRYGDRGFVPAAGESVKIDAKDCVPDRLTYAVTFGQRMEFFNIDSASTYLPYLDGAGTRTIMIAAPHGPPIKLYPAGPSPAHYMLRDQLGSGLVANVFLLNYATHDVTGLDGHYEIKNIPVGKVRVDAMLAVISKSDGKEIEIVEGDNTLDLTLHFDASKDLPQRAPPSASGTPSASAPPK
jgi:hypothetical protein